MNPGVEAAIERVEGTMRAQLEAGDEPRPMIAAVRDDVAVGVLVPLTFGPNEKEDRYAQMGLFLAATGATAAVFCADSFVREYREEVEDEELDDVLREYKHGDRPMPSEDPQSMNALITFVVEPKTEQLRRTLYDIDDQGHPLFRETEVNEEAGQNLSGTVVDFVRPHLGLGLKPKSPHAYWTLLRVLEEQLEVGIVMHDPELEP